MGERTTHARIKIPFHTRICHGAVKPDCRLLHHRRALREAQFAQRVDHLQRLTFASQQGEPCGVHVVLGGWEQGEPSN